MLVNDDFICCVVVYISEVDGDCNAGVITQVDGYCAGITESHIRASGTGEEKRSRGESKGSIRLRIKLSRVYILHTLFNFTTSRFNSDDGFSTITRPYFSPRVSSALRSPYPLPPFRFLSLSPSLP